MGRLAVFVALLLAVCIAEVSAFYSSSGPVVSLTASNFESKIKSGGVWLVEVRESVLHMSVPAATCSLVHRL